MADSDECETALLLQEQEGIIGECEGQCDSILALVDSDVLGVETEHFVDGTHATKSTVGIMVKDCVVRTQ